MKKKITALVMAAAMCLSVAACGSSDNGGSGDTAKDTYTVGICQLVQHQALDAATQGFKDALKEELGDKVEFVEQNAANDIPTCGTICNGFVSDGVDLILANATPALQAATAATQSIPILGTAVTEYGVALDIENFSGTVGGNVSGTSDLAPLDQQAAMFSELLPDAKTVGILYCSAEANSVYQADVVKAALEDKGITVKIYTFADSNDVATVTATACDECDALYIPTDNTAASCAEAINNVALPKKTPIITGEDALQRAAASQLCPSTTTSSALPPARWLQRSSPVRAISPPCPSSTTRTPSRSTTQTSASSLVSPFLPITPLSAN